MISQFLIRGLSLLVTPLYTRILSTEQFGIVKIYESWLLILVPVVTLGLFRSVEVAKYDYRDKFDNYVSSTVILGFILCFIFSLFCIILNPFVCKLIGFTPWMLYIMLFYIFAEFAIMCYQRREKQQMRYKNSVLFTSVSVPAATIVSVSLLLIAKHNNKTDKLLFYRISGYYIPLIIAGFFIALVMVCRHAPNSLAKDWKFGLKFSIPLVLELVSIQIMNQIDKIMIQRMVGASEAGIYSLATTISFIIWIIEDSVWSAWLPWLYEKLDRKEIKDINKPWTFIMHCFGIFSVLLTAFSPELIAVLGGKNYKVAAFIVSPLVISTLFRFYGYSFSSIQNYYKNTKYVALATVLAMSLNVVLNYIGIHYFGYIAAAYATAVTYCALMIILSFFEKKVAGKTVISLAKTLAISTTYFVICELCMITFTLNFYIRYIMIFCICLVFAFINKNKIISIINQLKSVRKNV